MSSRRKRGAVSGRRGAIALQDVAGMGKAPRGASYSGAALGFRTSPFLCAAILALLAAAYAAFVWHQAESGASGPTLDSYGYFYPNVLYALDSLQRGGEGLLWNRFQNSGQPFLGISLTGLLYPPHVLFLLGPEAGWVALLTLHLFVGGAGLFLLCRELGLESRAALCGALTFQFGGVTLFLAGWMPTIVANYVWMTVAFFLVERGLRQPSFPVGAALGVISAIQILAGYPQFFLFLSLAIGLRLVWELLSLGRETNWRGIVVVAAGLLLGPILAAVQLLPSLEVARLSVRALPLSDQEIFPRGHLTFEAFRERLARRSHFGSVLAAPTMLLAGLSLLDRKRTRIVAFYLALAVLFFCLAFDTPVLRFFFNLPFGRTFRMPNRFLVITGIAGAVLAGVGADWALEPGRRRVLYLVAPLAFLATFYLLAPNGLLPIEWACVAGLLTAGVAIRLRPVAAPAAGWSVPILILIGLVAAGSVPRVGMWTKKSTIFANEEVFAFVRERMTNQDRVLQLGRHLDYALMPKSTSIFRVPSITDYETQTSLRYAALMVAMKQGTRLMSVNQFYYGDVSANPTNRRLVDLLAARYLIVDQRRKAQPAWPKEGAVPLWRKGPVQVFENKQALPRAHFVERAVTIEDPDLLLGMLAHGRFDPRRVVLLEEHATLDSSRGGDPNHPASVDITSDSGEALTIEAVAPKAGFLVLTDQYFPGWQAHVNGEPARIYRANYAFRAVPIPAGRSTIVFRYRPTSLLAGALVSIAGGVILIAGWVAWRRRWMKVPERRTQRLAV